MFQDEPARAKGDGKKASSALDFLLAPLDDDEEKKKAKKSSIFDDDSEPAKPSTRLKKKADADTKSMGNDSGKKPSLAASPLSTAVKGDTTELGLDPLSLGTSAVDNSSRNKEEDKKADEDEGDSGDEVASKPEGDSSVRSKPEAEKQATEDKKDDAEDKKESDPDPLQSESTDPLQSESTATGDATADATAADVMHDPLSNPLSTPAVTDPAVDNSTQDASDNVEVKTGKTESGSGSGVSDRTRGNTSDGKSKPKPSFMPFSMPETPSEQKQKKTVYVSDRDFSHERAPERMEYEVAIEGSEGEQEWLRLKIDYKKDCVLLFAQNPELPRIRLSVFDITQIDPVLEDDVALKLKCYRPVNQDTFPRMSEETVVDTLRGRRNSTEQLEEVQFTMMLHLKATSHRFALWKELSYYVTRMNNMHKKHHR